MRNFSEIRNNQYVSDLCSSQGSNLILVDGGMDLCTQEKFIGRDEKNNMPIYEKTKDFMVTPGKESITLYESRRDNVLLKHCGLLRFVHPLSDTIRYIISMEETAQNKFESCQPGTHKENLEKHLSELDLFFKNLVTGKTDIFPIENFLAKIK